MRRTVTKLTLALGCLVGCGCIFQTSVNPYLGEADGFDLPALAGRWVEEEGGDEPTIVELSRGENGRWTVRLGEQGQELQPFAVRLGRLGGRLVWSMTPELQEREEPDFHALHLLPLHSAARLRLEGDRLEIAFLDPDWVARRARAGRLPLAHIWHEWDEGQEAGVVLTAPTGELSAFLAQHVADPEAFPRPCTLVRERE